MLTPDEAAKFLGVSSQTVRLWVKKGIITSQRFGGRIRIEEAVISDIAINGTPTNAKSGSTAK